LKRSSVGRWLTAMASLVLLASIASTAAVASVNQPNIVLIVVDDLDSGSLWKMPNIDALLRRQGTDFSNFFVSTPSCCPSRASILRGQYSHNHGVLRNFAPNGGYQTFRDRGN